MNKRSLFMSLTIDEILTAGPERLPVVMGILNITPDSFSDGGKFLSPALASDRAMEMIEAGADIIDIGAESTRPGSERVSADDQIARISGVIATVVETGIVVSIDTTLSQVAEYALDAGAAIINDVSAGRDDPVMLPLAGSRNAVIILMHMLGKPKTMQDMPLYNDVVAEVAKFLAERVEEAVSAGVSRNRCVIDPGIGFGKTLEHNLAIIANLDKLAEQTLPIMVGPSRKRFIGELTGETDPENRTAGTIATCLEAFRRGANIFRVHDVKAVKQALIVASRIGS